MDRIRVETLLLIILSLGILSPIPIVRTQETLVVAHGSTTLPNTSVSEGLDRDSRIILSDSGTSLYVPLIDTNNNISYIAKISGTSINPTSVAINTYYIPAIGKPNILVAPANGTNYNTPYE